ncbi:hypothetical protein GCM10020295_16940 [Streptomyces cinereospinus]
MGGQPGGDAAQQAKQAAGLLTQAGRLRFGLGVGQGREGGGRSDEVAQFLADAQGLGEAVAGLGQFALAQGQAGQVAPGEGEEQGVGVGRGAGVGAAVGGEGGLRGVGEVLGEQAAAEVQQRAAGGVRGIRAAARPRAARASSARSRTVCRVAA